MKNEFLQQLANNVMFRKLTSAFPTLKKEKLTGSDIEESLKSLKREGMLDALKTSGQDPKEIAVLTLNAFDHSVKIMRERLESSIKQMSEEIMKIS